MGIANAENYYAPKDDENNENELFKVVEIEIVPLILENNQKRQLITIKDISHILNHERSKMRS